MTKTKMILATLALAASQAYAVNKCPGPDGRPVFQDAPCAGGQAVNVRPATGARGDPDGQRKVERMMQRADEMEESRTRRETLDTIERDHRNAQRAIVNQNNERNQRECDVAKRGMADLERSDPLRYRERPFYRMYSDNATRYCN